MTESAGRDAPAIVVTGVSTGIGNATLHELIRAGYHVFGSVRKREDAERLSKELGDAYMPLLFDVTDAAAVAMAAESARRTLGSAKLAGLVNNAGVAVPGPLLEVSVDDFRRQIEINLVSVLAVTQAFFSLLRKAGEGSGRPARIVNIGSVSGLFALPMMGPYAASKHGIEGLSDSLRRECMLYGIDVVVIEPGRVATPIWDKADRIDISTFSGSPYLETMKRLKAEMVASGKGGYPPERIGRLVVRILAAKRPRARYLVGKARARIWMSRHEVTRRMIDRTIAKTLALTPSKETQKK